MRRIYIFRHGETDWNREGRIQGHLDVPLNERGRAQARRLAPHLKRLGVQAIVSSDLSRAFETAQLAAGRADLLIHSDERLREIHLGQLQGLSRGEIEQKFGVEFSDNLRHSPISDADVIRLGSESGDQVINRALAAIREFCHRHDCPVLGVSSHGGVVRRLVQIARGDDLFPPPISNCVIFPIDFDPLTDQWRLVDHLPL